MIFAETDGEPHNTITPIARMRNGKYELDLVLRNNLTTPEHPMGLYHPHEELHHIKKENIGLIEVMGLAICPGRLKKRWLTSKRRTLNGEDLPENRRTRQARGLGRGIHGHGIQNSMPTMPKTSSRMRSGRCLPKSSNVQASTNARQRGEITSKSS